VQRKWNRLARDVVSVGMEKDQCLDRERISGRIVREKVTLLPLSIIAAEFKECSVGTGHGVILSFGPVFF
jgi:hypothetical protein